MKEREIDWPEMLEENTQGDAKLSCHGDDEELINFEMYTFAVFEKGKNGR